LSRRPRAAVISSLVEKLKSNILAIKPYIIQLWSAL